jgi:signal peptidase I
MGITKLFLENIALLKETGKRKVNFKQFTKREIKSILKSILGWFLFLIFAIVFAVAMRVFLLASFLIPSGSMAPTLMPGDFIFTNKMIAVRDRNKIPAFNSFFVLYFRYIDRIQFFLFEDISCKQILF